MTKTLLITTRFPLLEFGGDKNRIIGISKVLYKKSKIDIVCLDKKKFTNKSYKYFKIIKVFQKSIILRLIQIILFLIKGKPLQVGFYYSKEMKEYINRISVNYDCIIFHTIRAAVYMPKHFKGKKILEMTDIMSVNLKNTAKELNYLNINKYIYYLESYLVKKYEEYISNFFDKIILISNKEFSENENLKIDNKIKIIKSGIDFNKNIFKFRKKNHKIIFLGNIKYLPNKLACYDFVQNIMPTLNNYDNKIAFHIIGNINNIDKILLKRYKNTVIHGPIKNLKKILTNAICCINNVRIATGFQTKVLTYMSYGIPTISSQYSKNKTDFRENLEILYYNSNKELINKILKLKNNKFFSEKISKNSYSKIKKKFSWKKRTYNYLKII
jgi:glycosyltransferase involved in cell wall biosynthesis